MATQKDPTQEPEKPGATPSSSDTRTGLDHLREGVREKQHVSSQLWDLLRDFRKLPSEERNKRLGVVLAAATPLLLTYIMGNKKEAPKKPENKRRRTRTSGRQAVAGPSAQAEEGVEEQDPRARRRKVVCDDMRLICINTDPAKELVPKGLQGKSSYLLEYGLPEFETFKEEMMDILAPDVTDKGKALKKVVDILKRSPMGKYQCMPQYLFGNVEEFKKYNLDWKTDGDEEKKMRAIWEFLQSEKMQREATRVYLAQSARQYGNDPELVAASFYGGGRAAEALRAYKAGTATPEQKEYVEKKQGAYRSILSYSRTSSGGTFDLEAELARTAARESGNLEGKKAKPRDASWESDQRFAYNRAPQEGANTQIA